MRQTITSVIYLQESQCCFSRFILFASVNISKHLPQIKSVQQDAVVKCADGAVVLLLFFFCCCCCFFIIGSRMTWTTLTIQSNVGCWGSRWGSPMQTPLSGLPSCCSITWNILCPVGMPSTDHLLDHSRI